MMEFQVFIFVIACALAAHAGPSPRQEYLANLVKRDLDRIAAVDLYEVCGNAHAHGPDAIEGCDYLGLSNATQTQHRNKRQPEKPVDAICSDPQSLQNNAEMMALCKRITWFNQNTNARPPVRVMPIVDVDSSGNTTKLSIKETTKEEESKNKDGWEKASKFFEVGSKAFETLEKFSDVPDKLKALNKAAQKIGKISKVLKVANILGKVGKALGALGAIASVCGPIGAGIGALFSLIALFIPQPDPNELLMKEMNKQFDKLHQRFDKLEQRLDSLEFTVQKTAVYQMYKENQDRIHKVWFAQRQMFMNPGSHSLMEFQDICRIENPLYALEWIHRRSLEGNSAFGLHLFTTILNDTQYDRVKLSEFMEIITSDMMMAAYLREACLGVQSPNNTNLIWKGRRVASMMIAQVSQRMAALEQELMAKFGEWQLDKDIKKVMDDYPDWKDNDRSQDTKVLKAIKQSLEEKYFWLTFELHLLRDKWSRVGPRDVSNYYLMDTRQKRKDMWLMVTWTEPDPLTLLACAAAKQNVSRSEIFEKGTNLDDFKTDNLKKAGGPNKVAMFFHSHDRLAKTTTGEECTLDSWNGPLGTLAFIVSYFKSYTLPGIYGCSAPIKDLAKVNLSRLDACPSKALAAEVAIQVTYYITGSKFISDRYSSSTSSNDAGSPAPTAVEQTGTPHPHASIKSIYVDLFINAPMFDFHWVALSFNRSDMPLRGCNSMNSLVRYEYRNCSFVYATPDKHSDVFVFSFSSYADVKILQEQANEAKHTLNIVKIIQKNLFTSDLDKPHDLMQKIHDLLTDSLKFFMTNGISEENFIQEISKNPHLDDYLKRIGKTMPTSAEDVHKLFNFYDNKIVTVSTGKATGDPEVWSKKITLIVHDRTASVEWGIGNLWVYLTYYTPYKMQNSKHCMIPQSTYDASYKDIGNRTLLFACEN